MWCGSPSRCLWRTCGCPKANFFLDSRMNFKSSSETDCENVDFMSSEQLCFITAEDMKRLGWKLHFVASMELPRLKPRSYVGGPKNNHGEEIGLEWWNAWWNNKDRSRSWSNHFQETGVVGFWPRTVFRSNQCVLELNPSRHLFIYATSSRIEKRRQ